MTAIDKKNFKIFRKAFVTKTENPYIVKKKNTNDKNRFVPSNVKSLTMKALSLILTPNVASLSDEAFRKQLIYFFLYIY